ncbi:hypothetical protein L1049_001351 [Liquidambar formosana]|uniref:Malectin-like domain-containing protein n=1 Tax=Liquidambar formosana TaxID=63359 RepID=A0AAP0NAS4_LIQFO
MSPGLTLTNAVKIPSTGSPNVRYILSMQVKWVPLVLAFVLFLCHGSYASFNPVDNHLIACGSSQNVTFQSQTYVPDSVQSSFVLKSQGNSVVSRSNSSVPSPIYQSARIFLSTASYKFEIQQAGRHWVRLYFYPFPDLGQNLTSASITVVTDDFVLLNNFTFKNYNGSYLFKEYAINVTSDSLTLTFIPSNTSVAFVNAIEVVSIPDEVLPDQALALNPSTPFSGLSELALETVYRLNMGGPLLTAQNDTLGRTWKNDKIYLHVNSSAANVSVNPGTVKYPVAVTPEIAPNWVYATAETMGDANVPNVNFNITWVFSVDPNFKYFVRVHFCDIVSKSLNTLVFNVFINSDSALGSLDLSSLTGDLGVPYYRDFVSYSSVNSDTLTVSVGPDSMAYYENAILNGLEIMKISNEARSLDGLSSVESILPKSSSNKSKIGIIIGSVAGSAGCGGVDRFVLLPLGSPQVKDYSPGASMAAFALIWKLSNHDKNVRNFSKECNSKLHLSSFHQSWPAFHLTPLEPFDNSVSMVDGVHSSTDDDGEDAATSAVFSQLVNPRGR